MLRDRSIAEARQACAAGADALFVKPQLVAEYLAVSTSGQAKPELSDAVFQQASGSRDLQRLIAELRHATSNDE